MENHFEICQPIDCNVENIFQFSKNAELHSFFYDGPLENQQY